MANIIAVQTETTIFSQLKLVTVRKFTKNWYKYHEQEIVVYLRLTFVQIER